MDSSKQGKQRLSANDDDNTFNKFLQELIKQNYLQNPALGITKRVISKGVDSLSERQEYVFQTYVEKKFKRECTFCRKTILDMNIPLKYGMCKDCRTKYQDIFK
ncbi:hypothetical protein LC613_42015 [Nostoc sphaeroides CHAB 2801]|uniref:hypothetical protein n=1 Tax=Nostoc sphaeroides TaxID=446679 RepID=UPI001E351E02|nr:hypothetical protein [Nostoc sphaeroides]MCC5633988.1 hypothetical protein [Nostoc sphaeroides CHAB 2801]